ncbi:M48 family metalloprotease [Thalassorhabdomicrobium marinisediminis]|uniref:Peptidase M48 n=1 Tax=Thalassorhabdomicrobium marinisediminis TaxID=2170577 RepID=A0A2T7FX12_9RHOB|nr:M48 family metalloprotease [Thalassorhabdomicrobium marinisediminis]PVA06715.1 peptidase M48 [Thalassorhabdomicrobium marinisediminis]
MPRPSPLRRLGFAALAISSLALSACGPVVVQPAPGPAPQTGPTPSGIPTPAPVSEIPRNRRAMERAFVQVLNRVEPVAERECRARARGLNCDFLIVVDDRPGQPANAFQTVDEQGRPIIAFTLALIADARNTDEIAFVMAHEAAHHIRDHLSLQRRNATLGAVVFGQLAGVTGGGADSVRTAQELGAAVGARTYSKDFELEADRLGAIITAKAGYDPLRGADFFFRIPDPGDKFLGTHPANAARIAAVRQTVAGL